LVEITLMRQAGRTLVHLVNLSGHSQTAYLDPIPMSDIRLDVAGSYRSARALRAARSLPPRQENGYTRFRLPRLFDYEVIVLE
jgi:hypothetical protein